MKNYLSNIETRIQDWLFYSNLGLLTSFMLIGMVITLLLGISFTPMALTLLYLPHYWMILVFPITVGLSGFVTLVGGFHFFEWTNGNVKIFNQNQY